MICDILTFNVIPINTFLMCNKYEFVSRNILKLCVMTCSSSSNYVDVYFTPVLISRYKLIIVQLIHIDQHLIAWTYTCTQLQSIQGRMGNMNNWQNKRKIFSNRLRYDFCEKISYKSKYFECFYLFRACRSMITP